LQDIHGFFRYPDSHVRIPYKGALWALASITVSQYDKTKTGLMDEVNISEAESKVNIKVIDLKL
jgi:hypothetical protein